MVTVAIQAGGFSRRMGRDKALIPLVGKPLIEHLLSRVEGLGEEILITTNRPQDYRYLGFRLASDPVPGEGALPGLHTALEAAAGDAVLVLACDMPFVSRPLLEHLLNLSPEADVVIPRHLGKYEPLHAVYRKQVCLPALKSSLASGKMRIISFFNTVKVLTVEHEDLARLDPRGLSFFNVNTPEDLARAERLLLEGD
jgi:molybdopterin-guanine dinucleotide biosynthesis protein A